MYKIGGENTTKRGDDDERKESRVISLVNRQAELVRSSLIPPYCRVQ